MKSFRERYKQIAESNWFKKHYWGKSLGDSLDVVDTTIDDSYQGSHTTVEQGLELVSIGVPCNTADLEWVKDLKGTTDGKYVLKCAKKSHMSRYDTIPSWTFEPLFRLLPIDGITLRTMTRDNAPYYKLTYKYGNDTIFKSGDNLIDIVYKMLITTYK